MAAVHLRRCTTPLAHVQEPRQDRSSFRAAVFFSAPLFAILVLLLAVPPVSACTAIVIGHAATVDGAGYTSSTADCLDCDFRIAKVPRRSGATLRPVYLYKANYPHVVQRGRADTWEPANLEGEPEQLQVWRNSGKGSEPIGYIPEANTTYALLESGAGYAIINEKMVAMSESSCLAKFVASPVSDGGHALLEIGELSRLALERTATARDAILLMGTLAEQYGYYGAEWNSEFKYLEAGENLMVSDPHEAFVFHILPDDTGKSAVWAAQRVPDDHVAVVANQFIIRNIDSSDRFNFIHSANMHEVALRSGFYDPAKDGPHLDFSSVFGGPRQRHSSYSSHRMYRVFTLVNPDLEVVLDPYPNALFDGYPFSVKAKNKLDVKDILQMQRDHYEGSMWDMTKTLAAQPFGDPDRYDIGPSGNLSIQEIGVGEFSRAISIGRTSYTAVARSTAHLPELVGAMAYIAQQQPDSSVFIPVYVATDKLPVEITIGSLFKFQPQSLFWSVLAVSNWVHRYYNRAIGDLRAVQSALEQSFDVRKIDLAASKLFAIGDEKATREFLSNFTVSAAAKAQQEYTALFPRLMARFHDGFRMEDPNAIEVNMTTMFYSPAWLHMVGFFESRESGGGDRAVAAAGQVREHPGQPTGPILVNEMNLEDYSSIAHTVQHPRTSTRYLHVPSLLGGLVIGVGITSLVLVSSYSCFLKQQRRNGYVPIDMKS